MLISSQVSWWSFRNCARWEVSTATTCSGFVCTGANWNCHLCSRRFLISRNVKKISSRKRFCTWLFSLSLEDDDWVRRKEGLKTWCCADSVTENWDKQVATSWLSRFSFFFSSSGFCQTNITKWMMMIPFGKNVKLHGNLLHTAEQPLPSTSSSIPLCGGAFEHSRESREQRPQQPTYQHLHHHQHQPLAAFLGEGRGYSWLHTSTAAISYHHHHCHHFVYVVVEILYDGDLVLYFPKCRHIIVVVVVRSCLECSPC